jgi:hypothetical protein
VNLTLMSRSITQDLRVRMINGFAPLRVFVVLIVLSGLVGASAVFLLQESRTLSFDCVAQSCPASLVSELQVGSKALVQDLDFTISLHVLPNALQGSLIDPRQITEGSSGQVILYSVGHGRYLVRIPERYGSSPSFDYYSPHLAALNSIRVRVVQGREMFIFINDKMSYTHRYQLPVFYSNPQSLIQNSVSGSAYVSTVKVAESKVYRENINLQRFSNVLFVFFGVCLSAIFCLLLLMGFKARATTSFRLRSAPFGWMKGLWVVCFIAWIMKPFDPTGMYNPGLFGPLGAAFSDYFQTSQMSHFSQPYLLGGVDYPPFALAVLKGLSYVLPGLLGFVFIVAICVGILSFMFIRVTGSFTGASRFKNAMIFLLPYPLVFGIVRGNIDLLAAALVWLAILFKDSKYTMVPALLLASAISLKVWPIVFLFFFLRWGHRKVAFMSIGLTALFSVVASLVLGYRSVSAAFHTILPSLSASTSITANAFHDTYSMSSLLYYGYILVLSANPLRSTNLDLANALSFVGSLAAKVLIAAVAIFLVRMIWKSRTVSRSYLFCAGLALLISTPTYTYRGVILVAYFYLVWRESSLSGEEEVDSRIQKHQIGSDMNQRSNCLVIGLNQERFMERLKRVREFAWLPILAPTTILFINDTPTSVGSVLQPASLMVLLAIEAYLLKLEERKVGSVH